jgi:hypothetical protein
MTMTELTFWMRRAVPQILSSSQVKKTSFFWVFQRILIPAKRIEEK